MVEMSPTGPLAAQCGDRVPYARTFWFNFEASVAIFVISAIAIPGLLVLSNLINSSPKDQSLSAPSSNYQDSDTTLQPQPHYGPAPTSAPTIPSKRRLAISQVVTLVRWMCSTILLGIASFLLTFQIHMALFTGYCLDGLIYTTDLVFICIITAIGSMIVALGFKAWLFRTVALVKDSINWCLDLKARTIQEAEDSAIADVRDMISPQEVQRMEEVNRRQHFEPSTATLPSHMV